MDELSPFTPLAQQPQPQQPQSSAAAADKTPRSRHSSSRRSKTTTPSTSSTHRRQHHSAKRSTATAAAAAAAAAAAHHGASCSSSAVSGLATSCSPLSTASTAASSLLRLTVPPRCPTASCRHHARLSSLCQESCALQPPLYLLSCPSCHALVYPCDGCHQVAAHPPAPLPAAGASSLPAYSACRECGFLTVLSPSLRSLLQLPPLLPLPPASTLAIQSAIDHAAYLKLKTAAYFNAFQAFRRAVNAGKKGTEAGGRGAGGGGGGAERKDGGESDGTDEGKERAREEQQDSLQLPRVDDESTLLRLREELLAINAVAAASQASAPQPQPPVFRYGVQPIDTQPFSPQHLRILLQLLASMPAEPIAPSSSSSSSSSSAPDPLSSGGLSSLQQHVESFFSSSRQLSGCVRGVRESWRVLQSVRRTYSELEQEERRLRAAARKRRRADSIGDEEDEEAKGDGRLQREQESKRVERGVMGIVENVISCRLQSQCERLHSIAAPHFAALSTVNRLLLLLYARICRSRGEGLEEEETSHGGSVLPTCEVIGGAEDDDAVSELLLCASLCRCLYALIISRLKEAVYWSECMTNEARASDETPAALTAAVADAVEAATHASVSAAPAAAVAMER